MILFILGDGLMIKGKLASDNDMETMTFELLSATFYGGG